MDEAFIVQFPSYIMNSNYEFSTVAMALKKYLIQQYYNYLFKNDSSEYME